MRRTRFAPSPTGLAARRQRAQRSRQPRSLGDWLLLRIDDTDPARNVPGGEDAILRDLEWLGLAWDEGPVRQSERRERHLEAAAPLGERFDGVTLVREDGTPTYHLASVVDDIDFGITHVIRGNDHRPNEALHRRLLEALGATPPEFVHHGLILGEDGKKLSKRAEGATVAPLRDAGHPGRGGARVSRGARPAAPRRPLDLPRIRRLAIEAIGAHARRGAGRARGRAASGRAGASRRARPERGARLSPRTILEPAPARCRATRGRRSSASASCASAPTAARRREALDPRAEGGRRRPEGAAARADRRASAGPSSGRSSPRCRATRPAEGRCGSLTRSRTRPVELPAAARADPDVLLRADRLPAHPRRQRASRSCSRMWLRSLAAARAATRCTLVAQHHGHQRQDLRRRARARARSSRRDATALVPRGHRRPRPRHARTSSRRRPRRSRRSSR